MARAGCLEAWRGVKGGLGGRECEDEGLTEGLEACKGLRTAEEGAVIRPSEGGLTSGRGSVIRPSEGQRVEL